MSDELLDVVGKCKWAKVFEHNRDPGSKPGDKYEYKEATTIELYPDKDQLKLIKEANPDVKINTNDEGDIYVKFRRAWHNSINPEWGGVPRVVDANGDDWDPKVLIGNDSVVRIAAQVYKTKHGKAMRLMGVQVLEHVEAELPETPDLPF